MKRLVVVAMFLLVLLVPVAAQDAGDGDVPPGDLKPYAFEVNLLGVLQFGPYRPVPHPAR